MAVYLCSNIEKRISFTSPSLKAGDTCGTPANKPQPSGWGHLRHPSLKYPSLKAGVCWSILHH